MMEKIKHLDPFIVIGVAISVALAVVLVLLGQDQISSLLVGLLTTAITLLIDIIARLKQGESQVLQATALGDLLTKDPELHTIVQQMTESYLSVKEDGFALFIKRAKDALLECEGALSGLGHGYLVTETGGTYAYGRRGTAEAQESVKGVSYETLEVWRTLHLKRVLQANAEAVKRGVQIERIFILGDDSLSQADDVLRAQREAGVQTYVVSPRDLPSVNMLESYIIVDDRVLVTFYPSREGQPREEKISINPPEVHSALKRFESIIRRARAYE